MDKKERQNLYNEFLIYKTFVSFTKEEFILTLMFLKIK